jgi:hypothetical protein
MIFWQISSFLGIFASNIVGNKVFFFLPLCIPIFGLFFPIFLGKSANFSSQEKLFADGGNSV